MGTILNSCKEARMESRNADSFIKTATAITMIKEDGEHVIGFHANEVDKALVASDRSIAKNETVIGELEKDSSVKEFYVEDIKKKKRFKADWSNKNLNSKLSFGGENEN